MESFKKIKMINKHKDLKRPFWVAKKKDHSTLHYGELKKGSEVASKMPIHTFETKKEMILFIEENGHEYINDEINKNDK